jgi:hypothetical protein
MCCCPSCRAQAQNNEATLAETLQKTTTQVSSELVELCCENHALSCENHELMQVRSGVAARMGWDDNNAVVNRGSNSRSHPELGLHAALCLQLHRSKELAWLMRNLCVSVFCGCFITPSACSCFCCMNFQIITASEIVYVCTVFEQNLMHELTSGITLHHSLRCGRCSTGHCLALLLLLLLLLQELIAAKLALAQCAEREVIWRREMYKARQTNKQLAEKMGRLESLVSVIVDKDQD